MQQWASQGNDESIDKETKICLPVIFNRKDYNLFSAFLLHAQCHSVGVYTRIDVQSLHNIYVHLIFYMCNQRVINHCYAFNVLFS